jgi:hypothetical protein
VSTAAMQNQKVTFVPISTASTPSFVGYVVPKVVANTALGIPATVDVLQLLPPNAPSPTSLVIHNTSPYTVSVYSTTSPSSPAITTMEANVGTYTASLSLYTQFSFGTSTSTTNFATLKLIGSTNVVPSLTVTYDTSSTQLFGVTIDTNGATGVFTATIYYLGPNGSPSLNYFNAVNGTNQAVVLGVLASTTATLQNLNVIDSSAGVANTITLPPASTTPVCVTSGNGVQLTVAIQSIAGGTPTPIPVMPSGNTATASTATGIGIDSNGGGVSTAIPAASVNWWGASPPVNTNTVNNASGTALRPTVNQATSQFTLLITSTPLLTVAATGAALTTSLTFNSRKLPSSNPFIGSSTPILNYPPQLLVPLDNTFVPGGGPSSAPAGVSSATAGAQVLPTVNTQGMPLPMALLNIDGGIVIKVPTTGVAAGDTGLASRWVPGSTQGAMTFFVPAYVQTSTKTPASFLPPDTSRSVDNVYTAQTGDVFMLLLFNSTSSVQPLPFQVAATTGFRVDVVVPLSVDFAVFSGTAAQFLGNVCGGNGFTRCRDIAGRPQTRCLGTFDTTVGGLCSAILFDTEGEGNSDYLGAYTNMTQTYCGQPGKPMGVGFSTDACACIATKEDNAGNTTINSPTTWTFPGEQGSTSFPDYVASFEKRTGTQFPQLMMNNAACWWPPCTGATPALLPLDVKTNCTQNVTNCFAAVNQITTDKTSTVSVDIIQACPSANTNDPGGGGNDDGGSADSANPVSGTKKSSKAVYISVGVVGAVVVAAIIAGFVVAIRRQNKRAAGST